MCSLSVILLCAVIAAAAAVNVPLIDSSAERAWAHDTAFGKLIYMADPGLLAALPAFSHPDHERGALYFSSDGPLSLESLSALHSGHVALPRPIGGRAPWECHATGKRFGRVDVTVTPDAAREAFRLVSESVELHCAIGVHVVREAVTQAALARGPDLAAAMHAYCLEENAREVLSSYVLLEEPPRAPHGTSQIILGLRQDGLPVLDREVAVVQNMCFSVLGRTQDALLAHLVPPSPRHSSEPTTQPPRELAQGGAAPSTIHRGLAAALHHVATGKDTPLSALAEAALVRSGVCDPVTLRRLLAIHQPSGGEKELWRGAQDARVQDTVLRAMRAVFGGAGVPGGYLQDKVDCVNEDASHCPGWAASGECQANPAYMLMSCALSCGLCPPPESREDFWKALSSPQRHMELQSAVIGHLKRRHHGDCIVDSHGMRVFEVCPGTRVSFYPVPADGVIVPETVQRVVVGYLNWQASVAAARQITHVAIPTSPASSGPLYPRAYLHVYSWGSNCQHHIGTEIQKDSRKEGQGKVAYSADVYMACRPAGLDDEVPHLIVSNHGECHFSIVALSRHMCEIPAVAWGV